MTIIDRVRGWFASWSRAREKKTVYDTHFHAGAVVNVYCTPCQPPPSRGRLLFKVGPAFDAPAGATATNAGATKRRPIHEEPDVMAEMFTEQFEVLAITPLDSRNKPVPVDGVPQWSTDNSDILTLEPSADGLSCKVTSGLMPTAPDTVVNVEATCDADLGAGVRTIAGVAAYVIKRREAVVVQLVSTGAPQDVPEPQPIPTPPE